VLRVGEKVPSKEDGQKPSSHDSRQRKGLDLRGNWEDKGTAKKNQLEPNKVPSDMVQVEPEKGLQKKGRKGSTLKWKPLEHKLLKRKNGGLVEKAGGRAWGGGCEQELPCKRMGVSKGAHPKKQGKKKKKLGGGKTRRERSRLVIMDGGGI